MTIEEDNDADLDELEHLLTASRPVPRPAFRGELRRQLLAGEPRAEPLRLRRLIAAYTTSGALLMAVAIVGIAGAGPLAAG